MSDEELRPIVVGRDGSVAAVAALSWAVEQARDAHARSSCPNKVVIQGGKSRWVNDCGVARC